MSATKRFYVYTLARPDGRIFYVGKGTRTRINAHEAEARNGCSCHKCCVIRKIWQNGGEVRRKIVFYTNDELEAYRREVQVIAQIGLVNLANVAPGGSTNFRPPIRALPDKPITEITDAEYVNHLRNITGMTRKCIDDMLERFRLRKLRIFEQALRRAKHNQRMNGWDTQAEIDHLNTTLDDLYISLGWARQERLW